jgi:hypothetical protein
MKRESHVQFCERPGVQFLRPTHLLHFGLETALFKDGHFQGFCEVKSPRDHWDFEFPKDLKPGEIREQSRRDPAAPNLGLHIVKAAKQFDSVNPTASQTYLSW